MVLDIAPVATVKPQFRARTTEGIQNDVMISGKTTSPKFPNLGKPHGSIGKREENNKETIDADNTSDFEIEREDRELRKFVDYVLKGVSADVIPDVSTSGQNRPIEGSTKDDETKTKETGSKNKKDNYINLDDIISDDEPVSRNLLPV